MGSSLKFAMPSNDQLCLGFEQCKEHGTKGCPSCPADHPPAAESDEKIDQTTEPYPTFTLGRLSKLDGNSGKGFTANRRMPLAQNLGCNQHGFLQSIDFGGRDPNPAFPACAALEVFDCNHLASDVEIAVISAAEPIVECRD